MKRGTGLRRVVSSRGTLGRAAVGLGEPPKPPLPPDDN
jgi:hypothetical protein